MLCMAAFRGLDVILLQSFHAARAPVTLAIEGRGAYRACVPIRKTADEGESNEGDRQKKADALGHGAASASACIWGEGRREG